MTRRPAHVVSLRCLSLSSPLAVARPEDRSLARGSDVRVAALEPPVKVTVEQLAPARSSMTRKCSLGRLVVRETVAT
jgi:hypothetical protein